MLDCRIGGTYEKPFAIDDDRFLVSKGGTIQLRDFDANAVIAALPAGRDGLLLPAADSRDRRRRRCVTGTVMDDTAELPEDGSVSGAWATVFMQDVYNGLEPHVKRGEIKQIAVVQEIEKSTHTPQNNQQPDGHGHAEHRRLRLPVPAGLLRGDLRAEEGLGLRRRRRGRQRRLQGPLGGADLLPGPRRRRPGPAADADASPT